MYWLDSKSCPIVIFLWQDQTHDRSLMEYWSLNQQCHVVVVTLGRITTLVLCRQSPLNLHQFRLTRDSKYGLVGTDRNAIWRYFASIWLYLALLFIMSIFIILKTFIRPCGNTCVTVFAKSSGSRVSTIKVKSFMLKFDLLMPLSWLTSKK